MAGISNEKIVIDIAPLREVDRNRWNFLARSYKTLDCPWEWSGSRTN